MMDESLQRAPIAVLEVSAEGAVSDVNDAARDLLDVGDLPPETPVAAVAPRSVEDSLLDALRGDAATETAFEEYYPDLDAWLAVSVVSTDDGATVYLDDVSTRRRHEQSVDRLRAERDRTAVIDDVLSQVLAALVDASSRGEIAETICTALGETSLYEFAWVGEREPGSDEVVVRASAGQTGETFAAVQAALGEPTTTPEELAVESGRPQAVQPLAEATTVPEAVRMAGFADGVQSVLAIPLVYDGNVYGVVGVYASGTDAFSDRERTSFETLGEIAGFAVTAARNRTLLLSDAVTEVTFEVGTDSVLAGLSRALDATVTLQGMVPQEDAVLVCFVAVDGDHAGELAETAADTAGVRNVRTITHTDSGGEFAIEVAGSTPLRAVSSLGGTVRGATFEGGSGRLVVDLPPDGDVGRIADAVRADHDATVVAKRARDRPVTTTRGFRDALGEELTDRQRTVLRAAYLSGYFESPRGSTAEEVASSLDISGSTLLYHLRTGQRKLLDAFFDGETASGED